MAQQFRHDNPASIWELDQSRTTRHVILNPLPPLVLGAQSATLQWTKVSTNCKLRLPAFWKPFISTSPGSAPTCASLTNRQRPRSW